MRAMCASGVCQRMVSETIDGISAGLARSLAYWSGLLFSAKIEPEMVFRVVSLPPMISRSTLEKYWSIEQFRVSAPCASIEIRSPAGAAFTRSFHSRMKYARAVVEQLRRLCS